MLNTIPFFCPYLTTRYGDVVTRQHQDLSQCVTSDGVSWRSRDFVSVFFAPKTSHFTKECKKCRLRAKNGNAQRLLFLHPLASCQKGGMFIAMERLSRGTLSACLGTNCPEGTTWIWKARVRSWFPRDEALRQAAGVAGALSYMHNDALPVCERRERGRSNYFVTLSFLTARLASVRRVLLGMLPTWRHAITRMMRKTIFEGFSIFLVKSLLFVVPFNQATLLKHLCHLRIPSALRPVISSLGSVNVNTDCIPWAPLGWENKHTTK